MYSFVNPERDMKAEVANIKAGKMWSGELS